MMEEDALDHDDTGDESGEDEPNDQEQEADSDGEQDDSGQAVDMEKADGSEEEMEDNRWGLRGEDGVAGNILAGTVDAVWVPLDIAYGLTEASPDVIMPESFKTGMVASYLAGERGATRRM